MMKTSAIIF